MLEDIYKRGLIYDIETYPNCFTITVYSLKADSYRLFKWYKNENDIEEFLKIIKDRILIGFNSARFDDIVILYVYKNAQNIVDGKLSVTDIYQFTQDIISGEVNIWDYTYGNKLFESIDLLEIIRAGFNTISLKGVAVNLKYPKVQDLPLDFSKDVEDKDYELLCLYNKNDVDVTVALFNSVKDRLEMREVLSKQYKLNLYSFADSGIAKALFNKFYKEEALKLNPAFNFKTFKELRTYRTSILISDIVYDYVSFRTPLLQDYLNKLKQLTIAAKGDKFTCDIPALKYGGVTYTVALGGIHSEDEPLIIKVKDDELLLDVDISSQYPSAIINNKVCPQHLDKNVFIKLLKDLIETRFYYKKRKKESSVYKALEAGCKIALNSCYGFFNYKDYWLYDPKATFETTINNQLTLLMLIERLVESGYNVISANTDGILLHIKKDDLEPIRHIYKKWELETGFTFEETYFESYFRKDVNNYLARTTTKEIKSKGLFRLQEDDIKAGVLIKGFQFPIIAIALQRYYLDNIPVEKTIRNHRDIYDYCSSQKVGKQFKNVLQKVQREILFFSDKSKKAYKKVRYEDVVINEKEIQKTVRYYITTPLESKEYIVNKVQQVSLFELLEDKYNFIETGNVLKKLKSNGQYFEYAVGYYIQLFNDYYDVEWEDYNINYQFYIDKCNEEINKIG